MKDASKSSLPPLQFSLREIFIIVTLAATLCAAIAPAFRSWTPQRQGAYLMTMGVLALLAGGFLFLWSVWIVRVGGRRRELLMGRGWNVFRAIFGCKVILLLAVPAVFICEMPLYLLNLQPPATWLWIYLGGLLLLLYVLLAVGIAFSAVQAWSGCNCLDVRERGIVLYSLFYIRTGSIRYYWWRGRLLKIRLKWFNASFRPQASDAAALDALLTEHLRLENKSENVGVCKV